MTQRFVFGDELSVVDVRSITCHLASRHGHQQRPFNGVVGLRSSSHLDTFRTHP
jgi:hypothetical protein